MNIDATIKVLSNERACVVRQTEGGCDRKCDGCDLVLPDRMILSAYGTAIDILLSQQEKEKNEPLTEDQLLDMNGMPAYDAIFKKWCLIKRSSSGRGIICVYENGTTIGDPFLGREYYRRPPEEGQT